MSSILFEKLGPILSINENATHGFDFNWDLSGLSTPKVETFHVFYFIGLNARQSNIFYQGYCSELKNGDIIGIYTPAKRLGAPGAIQWNEKSGLNSEKYLFSPDCLAREFCSK